MNLLNDDDVYVLIDQQLVVEQNFRVVQNDHMKIHQDDLYQHYLNKNEEYFQKKESVISYHP